MASKSILVWLPLKTVWLFSTRTRSSRVKLIVPLSVQTLLKMYIFLRQFDCFKQGLEAVSSIVLLRSPNIAKKIKKINSFQQGLEAVESG